MSDQFPIMSDQIKSLSVIVSEHFQKIINPNDHILM